VHGRLGGGVGRLADLAVEGGDRRGEHDRAALPVHWFRPGDPGRGQPQDVVGTDQVHPDHFGERVERARVALLIEDPDPVTAASRAVHGRAQRAVGGLDRVERVVHCPLVGNVGLSEHDPGAEAGQVVVGRGVQVDDADPGAGRQQAADGRQAEPGRAAGD
jgi:hypothetical protein